MFLLLHALHINYYDVLYIVIISGLRAFAESKEGKGMIICFVDNTDIMQNYENVRIFLHSKDRKNM